jgi:hypothetical protein
MAFEGGGAADLFNARVPKYQAGRWKSDVALDYWRDGAM